MPNNKYFSEKFNRDGFIKLTNILSSNSLKRYSNEIDKIFNFLKENNFKSPFVNYTKDGKVNTAHNLNKVFKKKLTITNFIRNKKLNSILESLLGKNYKVRNVEVFNKPARTGMPAPIHQDNFYWNVKDKKAINLWLSFNNVSNKNGGMYYFKGSQKMGLIKHVNSYAKGSSKKISEKRIKIIKQKYKKITPSLKPGDLLIHHCEVIHGSSKNCSQIDRRAIVISLISKNSKYDKKKIKSYVRDLNNQIKIRAN